MYGTVFDLSDKEHEEKALGKGYWIRFSVCSGHYLGINNIVKVIYLIIL